MFCTDDFRYIVVNNGIDTTTSLEISRISKELGLEEIVIKDNNRIKMTAMHHKEALQYCYDNYICKDDADIRVVMDCDIIPFARFSFQGPKLFCCFITFTSSFISSYHFSNGGYVDALSIMFMVSTRYYTSLYIRNGFYYTNAIYKLYML